MRKLISWALCAPGTLPKVWEPRLEWRRAKPVCGEMQRLALCLVLSLLGVAASSTAAPIQYNLTFIKTSGTGPAPTSGSFRYDATATADPFSNFVVTVNAFNLDFTLMANNPPTTNCDPSPLAAPGHDTFAALFSGTTPCGGLLLWNYPGTPNSFMNIFDEELSDGRGLLIQSFSGFDASGGGAQGTFTVSAANAVPEPGTLGLMISGGAILALWHRRRRSTV